MARLHSIGFELNSITAGMEYDGSLAANGTVQGLVPISGEYAFQIANLVSGQDTGGFYQFASSNVNGPIYVRFSFRVDTRPSIETIIFEIDDTGMYISLDGSGLLRLYRQGGTQIGSASSALTTGTRYYIEAIVDRSGAGGTHTIAARINGVQFAGATNLTIASGVNVIYFGANFAGEANSAGSWFFDDFAINDSSGSFQNTYAGDGRILHLRPDSAGDNSDWTNDYLNVLETTPDDGTTIASSNTLNQVDDHNLISTDAFVYQGEGSTGVGFGEVSGTRYRGMSFIALTTGIDGISFQLNSVGSRGMRVYLYNADSGDLPTGSELAHWDISNASLSTSFTKYSLTPYTSLTIGNKYAIYYAPWDVGGTNTYTDDYRDMVWKNSNVYGGGKPIVNNAGTWAISDSGNLDQKFALWYTNWAIDSDDVINVVQVGVRFNGAGASLNASFVLRVKASSGGTVEESSAITPSNTTYASNASAVPHNYSLTLYDLPGASTTTWTKSDLDAMQIGYRLSSISVNAAQISTVWALVDYTPFTAAAGGSRRQHLPLLGVG